MSFSTDRTAMKTDSRLWSIVKTETTMQPIDSGVIRLVDNQNFVFL